MRAVRVWITVELLFGLFGASAVLLDPAATATNFAWPIASPAAASVLGACYGSVAVMLAAALFARHWGQVRPVVAAAGVLTSVMLLATFLHWDVFTRDSVAFVLWFVSYLLPPATLLALWVWQERRPPVPATDPLPGWAANLFMGNAVILGSVWTFLFFVLPVRWRGSAAQIIAGTHPGHLGAAALADALAVVPPRWRPENPVNLLQIS